MSKKSPARKKRIVKFFCLNHLIKNNTNEKIKFKNFLFAKQWKMQIFR